MSLSAQWCMLPDVWDLAHELSYAVEALRGAGMNVLLKLSNQGSGPCPNYHLHKANPAVNIQSSPGTGKTRAEPGSLA